MNPCVDLLVFQPGHPTALPSWGPSHLGELKNVRVLGGVVFHLWESVRGTLEASVQALTDN
jgi:carbonic anhydrase